MVVSCCFGIEWIFYWKWWWLVEIGDCEGREVFGGIKFAWIVVYGGMIYLICKGERVQ